MNQEEELKELTRRILEVLRDKGYGLAWCRGLARRLVERGVRCLTEEQLVLWGDPAASRPQGVIEAPRSLVDKVECVGGPLHGHKAARHAKDGQFDEIIVPVMEAAPVHWVAENASVSTSTFRKTIYRRNEIDGRFHFQDDGLPFPCPACRGSGCHCPDEASLRGGWTCQVCQGAGRVTEGQRRTALGVHWLPDQPLPAASLCGFPITWDDPELAGTSPLVAAAEAVSVQEAADRAHAHAATVVASSPPPPGSGTCARCLLPTEPAGLFFTNRSGMFCGPCKQALEAPASDIRHTGGTSGY